MPLPPAAARSFFLGLGGFLFAGCSQTEVVVLNVDDGGKIVGSYPLSTGTTILGYAIFGNFPDLWTWIGAAVIIASGLYIALRERHLRAAR